MWETLLSVGLPRQYVEAVRKFYKKSTHIIKLHGMFYQGPEVKSGERQGCPLSGILFAICADVLISMIWEVYCNEDVVLRAVADDTAVVVEDYTKSVPVLAQLFNEYEQISSLALNKKGLHTSVALLQRKWIS